MRVFVSAKQTLDCVAFALFPGTQFPSEAVSGVLRRFHETDTEKSRHLILIKFWTPMCEHNNMA